jgi:hypothetical protein
MNKAYQVQKMTFAAPAAAAPAVEGVTPLPWRIDGPDQFGDYNILHEGDSLAIGAVVSNMRPPEEVAANAALIVAAVNSYPSRRQLVEALRELTDRFETAVRLSGSDPEYVAAAVKRYRDILAQEPKP